MHAFYIIAHVIVGALIAQLGFWLGYHFRKK